jgi:glycosyltransferase involved in cell wall biosynthesis
LNQLKALRARETNSYSRWKVIHNSFNADFKPVPKKEAEILLMRTGNKFNKPFLLHVGSRLVRKNRKLLLDMVALVGDQWDGNICYAGEPIDEELSNYARSLDLEKRIISVEKPDHLTLVALYNASTAFIFPSFSEGFGWPLIEAQACGTPVLASNIEPLMEVSAGTALHADPSKPEQFAEAFLSLKNDVVRSELIEKGFDNTLRFRPEKMVDAYLDLYGVSKKYKSRKYVS